MKFRTGKKTGNGNGNDARIGKGKGNVNYSALRLPAGRQVAETVRRVFKMHEWAIAESLVDQVVEIGRKEGLETVSKVSLKIGILRQVVIETLKDAFQMSAEGVLTPPPTLEVAVEPLRLKCRRCGSEGDGEGFLFRCADCESAEVDILTGKELYIDYVEGERGR